MMKNGKYGDQSREDLIYWDWEKIQSENQGAVDKFDLGPIK